MKAVPWRVPDKVTPIDFARRANTQTLRDRKALSAWKRTPPAVDVVEHERRMLRTEYVGGFSIGFLCGAVTVAFIAFVVLWVYIGGLPYEGGLR